MFRNVTVVTMEFQSRRQEGCAANGAKNETISLKFLKRDGQSETKLTTPPEERN